jgi:ribonuclease HI
MAGQFRAAIDGGSRGNPGPAAWGVAVLGSDGETVEGHAGFIGRATNNVAEYRALIEALELAVSRAAADVEILADSELVVRQIQGSYRVRNESLKPLWSEAMRLARSFSAFRIVHVRRESNKEADRLVNLALDRAESDPESADTRIVESGSDR